jgi:hypothetical protein
VAVSGLVLRYTGLLSRSASPPLQLAALRWPGSVASLERWRPPSGVSTACSVAVTHFSGRPFPGEPHTVLCSSKLESWRHNTVYCTPAGARHPVLRAARDSRAQRSTRSGAPATRRVRGPWRGAWRPPVASRPDASQDIFSGAWLRHARFGEPRQAGAPLGLFLRFTGLPSRSALVAPPLRLAAQRWRETFVVLGESRPPSGVSTAFLPAVALFSAAPFPGEPHTVL